jgi:ubiquitin-protein ligase
VRNGYYKQGKFRFCIDLEGFPQKQPRIFFKTKMYHPLVDYKTGQLDINAILNESWNYAQESLFYNLMNEFKNIFTNNEILENKGSFNPQAAFLL